MNYITQMDAAKRRIITKGMEMTAQKEKMTAEEIRALVPKGQVVIPCNKVHKSMDPNGIDSMLRTKINVNLGISGDCKDMSNEVEKLAACGFEGQLNIDHPFFTADGKRMSDQSASYFIGYMKGLLHCAEREVRGKRK